MFWKRFFWKRPKGDFTGREALQVIKTAGSAVAEGSAWYPRPVPDMPKSQIPKYARDRLAELTVLYAQLLEKIQSDTHLLGPDPVKWDSALLLLEARIGGLGRRELQNVLDSVQRPPAGLPPSRWDEAIKQNEIAGIRCLLDEASMLRKKYDNTPNLTYDDVWPDRKIWQ